MELSDIMSKYICHGCVNDSFDTCFELKFGEKDISCKNHCAGTFITGIGKILLGMPKGFNRYGSNDIEILIYLDFNDRPPYPYNYEIYNIPVCKHFDGDCTLVRGLSPRVNKPFIHIYKGDVRDKIECLEISSTDIENMD
jgi:hypothetical protein